MYLPKVIFGIWKYSCVNFALIFIALASTVVYALLVFNLTQSLGVKIEGQTEMFKQNQTNQKSSCNALGGKQMTKVNREAAGCTDETGFARAAPWAGIALAPMVLAGALIFGGTEPAWARDECGRAVDGAATCDSDKIDSIRRSTNIQYNGGVDLTVDGNATGPISYRSGNRNGAIRLQVTQGQSRPSSITTVGPVTISTTYRALYIEGRGRNKTTLDQTIDAGEGAVLSVVDNGSGQSFLCRLA
ncbi:MAG: hypothetical protein F6K17_41070 [Okeania sp. SIO3C4]|nr:hypothetical protein [Okeania sp. SIO3C4]